MKKKILGALLFLSGFSGILVLVCISIFSPGITMVLRDLPVS